MPKIKDIPKVDRPREKIIKYGPGKLNDSELLAVLLRTGTKNLDVMALSKKIIRKFGRKKLAKASFNDLKNHFGLGPAKALEIIACFELGKRFLNGKKTELLLSPKNVWESMKGIRENKREHFAVFYLDTRNQKIQREIISVGILNASLIHPREVFEPAIRHSAAQIIISHNHPSDNVYPSKNDIEVTKRLKEAGDILGIEIIDHVIVSKNSFLSLKCDGLL
jgi:DNA repair protein RadC